MAWTKMELVAILATTFCLISFVAADSKLGYGDECTIGSGLASIVSSKVESCGDNLACLTGTCTCNPALFLVHQKGFLGWDLLGGGCKRMALAACTDSDSVSCVSNAQCKNHICVCNEGYAGAASVGVCNGAVKLGMTPFYFLAMMISYFIFN